VRPSEMFQKPSWKRPAFEQVLEFLEESKVAWREEREREAAKERKLLLAQEREARAHELATNQKTWLRWMIAVSAVAAALALVAGGLALYLRGTKSELENIVLSSRLAQQSKALAAANPQLGV